MWALCFLLLLLFVPTPSTYLWLPLNCTLSSVRCSGHCVYHSNREYRISFQLPAYLLYILLYSGSQLFLQQVVFSFKYGHGIFDSRHVFCITIGSVFLIFFSFLELKFLYAFMYLLCVCMYTRVYVQFAEICFLPSGEYLRLNLGDQIYPLNHLTSPPSFFWISNFKSIVGWETGFKICFMYLKIVLNLKKGGPKIDDVWL